MIRGFEIVHSPSRDDPNRYRISLSSDSEDVQRVRSIFPKRAGVLWVPRRKPFNCAFFLYKISPKERADLEQVLAGKTEFPHAPLPPPKKSGTAEDSEENNHRALGIGQRSVKIAYFVPDDLPRAAEKAQALIERTLQEKKVSVVFETAFSLGYANLSLPEIKALIAKCHELRVQHVIAVGEPVHLQGARKIAKEAGVAVQILSQAVIDEKLGLTLIAEILSME